MCPSCCTQAQTVTITPKFHTLINPLKVFFLLHSGPDGAAARSPALLRGAARREAGRRQRAQAALPRAARERQGLDRDSALLLEADGANHATASELRARLALGAHIRGEPSQIPEHCRIGHWIFWFRCASQMGSRRVGSQKSSLNLRC